MHGSRFMHRPLIQRAVSGPLLRSPSARAAQKAHEASCAALSLPTPFHTRRIRTCLEIYFGRGRPGGLLVWSTFLQGSDRVRNGRSLERGELRSGPPPPLSY